MAAAKLKNRRDVKRENHESTRTIDHFFSKKPDSSNNPGNLNTTRKATTSKRPLDKRSTLHNSEVIIIDSDDEVDIAPTRAKAKKRRIDDDSDSDVEIVDVKSTVTKCAIVETTVSLARGAAASGSISPTFAFGKPGLLHDAVSGADSDFTFGNASTLLQSTVTPKSLSPKTAGVKEEENTQVDIDLSEEWLMDDDEIDKYTFKEDEDDDEVEFVDESLTDRNDSFFVGLCPCCKLKLEPSMAETHINSCLDSQGSGQSSKALQAYRAPSIDKGNTKSSTGSNVFSVLMSSFKENQAWKEASIVEDKTFRPVKANGGRRKAPFYKVLTGMPVAVDAFRYGAIPGVTAYFLSHAHSDHYTNLSSGWKSGPIYCSEVTANLIMHMLSVDKKWIRPLPMDTQTIIPDTGGVQVTLIEANHCPGSCLFLFEGQQTVNAGDSTFRSTFVGSSRIFRYLHCGDFRASPKHITHPVMKGKKIDCVYLDTTYLDPRYTFPPQPLVISACAELSRRLVAGEPTTENKTMKSWLPSLSSLKPAVGTKGRILVVVGTYSIGKERIVKAVAHALDSKIYCDTRKTAILRCEGDRELESMLTSKPLEATIHLVPLGTIATDRLKIYMDRFGGTFTRVIGFRPTGWTYAQPSGTDQLPSIANILARASQKDFTYVNLHPSPKSTSSIQVYGVPYSEHSSFYELTCFAMSFNWVKVTATVNVNSESSRGKMAKWVERWEGERRKRGADVLVTPRRDDYW